MAQIALQAPKKVFQANPLPVAGRSTAVARIPATQPLLKQSTAVHPAAIWISIGAFAWFVIAQPGLALLETAKPLSRSSWSVSST